MVLCVVQGWVLTGLAKIGEKAEKGKVLRNTFCELIDNIII